MGHEYILTEDDQPAAELAADDPVGAEPDSAAPESQDAT